MGEDLVDRFDFVRPQMLESKGGQSSASTLETLNGEEGNGEGAVSATYENETEAAEEEEEFEFDCAPPSLQSCFFP